jgi:predicted negative regulator of RcsB-dependent stress response
MSERTHRHELEKNLLADWLAEKYEVVKPYGTQLAVGGLIAAAVLVGAIYYFSQSDTVTPRAWQAYFSAYGEDKVADALKDTYVKPPVSGTTAELWARLSYADQRFQFASLQGGQDSQEAKTALADAEKSLAEIVDKTSDPLLLARIRYSLARIYESQNKPNKAREYYKQIVDAGKDTALGKRAAEAIRRLNPDGEVVAVLAWLAEQKPLTKTPGSNSPFDSLGPGFGGLGGFGQQPTLPERPNLNLPGTSPFGPSGADGIDFGREAPPGTKGKEPEGAAPDLNAPQSNDPATKSGVGEKGEVEKPPGKKAVEPADPPEDKPAAEKSAEPAKADE